MTSVYRTVFNLSAHQRPTVGDQKVSYTSVDHMGWLLCDGRALSTETYALLFGVIGYDFGGSGNTFNLPDPRGRAVGIAGQGSGLTNRDIGNSVGTETHTLSIAEMPTHNHGDTGGATISGGNHTHTYLGIQAQQASTLSPTTDVAENDPRPTETTTGTGEHSHTLTAQGGGNAHNNMQPTLFAGNMFIYSGKVVQQYFPYTWVNTGTPTPPAFDPTTPVVPGKVLIF